MEGRAWGHAGLHMGGIGCYSRWEPGSTGMAALVKAVVQEHDIFQALILCERCACSHGRRGFLWFS